MIYLFALLIGIIAGLRTMTAPTVVSWAAHLLWIPVKGTPLAFLSATITTCLFTLGAVGEYVVDTMPKTPSRKSVGPFGARIVTGALSGSAIGGSGHSWVFGAIAGVMGAVIGTLGGYEARKRMAAAFGRDLPAALLEDVVAIGCAIGIVCLAR